MKPRRFALVLAALLAAWVLAPVREAQASPAPGLPAGASCAALAAADPSASNGAAWGQTILPGHGAVGGWFGVDVCANAINLASPGGANLSCDRPPADFARTGCAPGRATYDGFGLSFQCVELVARFAAWAFGDAPGDWHGDAPDLWLPGNHPADMTALANGGTAAPVAGDILVWGHANARGAPWPAGPNNSHDGHTAVVAAIGAGSLSFVEENALSGARNVARETVPLTQHDGHWNVSGAGGPRILYGWLHSSRFTGHWPSATPARDASPTAPALPTATAAPSRKTPSTATAAPSSATPAPATGPTPATLPALDSGVMVTPAGTLTALDWSGGALKEPHRGSLVAPPAQRPSASNVDLGAPDGTTLALSQAPIALVTTAGDDVYALGRDGKVYEAHLAPHSTQATWTALGAPPGIVFAGGVAAATIPGAVVVGAVASDGTLWWRAGPPGDLGAWAAIGRPASTLLVGPPVLAGEPGSGLPSALALGRDGVLYQIAWSAPGDGGTDAAGGWGQWAAIALPANAGALVSPLFATSETPAAHARIGQWTDSALDLVARSHTGAVWLLRRGADPTWSATAIGADGQADQLLGVVAPPAPAGDRSAWLHIYTASHGVISLGEVTLTSSSAPVALWTAFDAAASLRIGPQPPTALVVGPRASVLLSASGSALAIVGTPPALTLLTGAP